MAGNTFNPYSDIKTDVVVKIADSINESRRQELLRIYLKNNEFKDYVAKARAEGTFKHGNKSKSMRKIASYPVVVDEFFSKVYGKDYYKDPDFFMKYGQEWIVIDPKDF